MPLIPLIYPKIALSCQKNRHYEGTWRPKTEAVDKMSPLGMPYGITPQSSMNDIKEPYAVMKSLQSA